MPPARLLQILRSSTVRRISEKPPPRGCRLESKRNSLLMRLVWGTSLRRCL